MLAPGQLGDISFSHHLYFLAVDNEIVPFNADRARKSAGNRNVIQAMGQGLGVGQVVYDHHLKVRILGHSLEYVPSDSAKSVDCYSDCHMTLPFFIYYSIY